MVAMSIWTRLGLAVFALAFMGVWACNHIVQHQIKHGVLDKTEEAKRATLYIVRTGLILFMVGIVAIIELAVLFVGGWL
jgi:DMSO/TMAO reductase YedYZ heme-binding membrane subunit